jgi:hypothetical protein
LSDYYSSNTLVNEIIPWLHIEEAEGKLYVMSFRKLEEDVEASLYESYYALNDRENIYSNSEANSFLTLANLQANVFTSNIVNRVNSDKVFVGHQLNGNTQANGLYQLIDAVYYTFNANASYNADGSKKPQLWQIYGGEAGYLTLPNPFIFDKNQGVNTAFEFNFAPVVRSLVNLDNSGLANSCVILHYNPTHGFYCNKSLTPTSNAHATMVTFLPSISLTVVDNTVFSTTLDAANLQISVTYSNNLIYPSAQSKVMIDSTTGFVALREVAVNSSANVQIIGLNMLPSATMKVTAGWPNYVNVSSVSLNVANNFIPPVPSKVEFSTPGSYTYTMPNVYSQAIVRVYGGGGGGGNSGFSPAGVAGANGTNSSFNVTVLARGGQAGNGASIGEGNPDGESGAGGLASGGDVNIQGYVGPCPGPDGGLGGVLSRDATPYGGGGGGTTGPGGSQVGGAGGSGGYSQKTYTDSELTGNVAILVGSGGAGAGTAGDGANGGVTIEFTA